MKTVVRTMFVIGALIVLVVGVMVVRGGQSTRNARAELAVRELAARTAEAEAARARAETWPDVVHETYSGQSILTIVRAQARQSEAMNDALILLATEDVRARDSWRSFVQMSGGLSVVVASALGVMLYGRRIADALEGRGTVEVKADADADRDRPWARWLRWFR